MTKHEEKDALIAAIYLVTVMLSGIACIQYAIVRPYVLTYVIISILIYIVYRFKLPPQETTKDYSKGYFWYSEIQRLVAKESRLYNDGYYYENYCEIDGKKMLYTECTVTEESSSRFEDKVLLGKGTIVDHVAKLR